MQFDVRRFDIYRKIPKDLTQPTLTGACVSISSLLFIVFLFLSEFSLFISTQVESELYVDDPVRHSEKIPVFINLTLPKMPCVYLGLDIQDEMGRHEVGVKGETNKIETPDKLGCRFESHFLINKVPGNFHVSTHSSSDQPIDPDMTHFVHELRFGQTVNYELLKGSFNPMLNLDKTKNKAQATHDYIIRIVPTVYKDLDMKLRFPFQYTFSHRELVQLGHGGGVMPAIWFRYDLSPITVMYKEKRKPFYTFLTTICAIIGGTFTVAGIIDSLIFTASELVKKAELGKLS